MAFGCCAAEFDIPIFVNFDALGQEEDAVVHSFAAVDAEVTIKDIYNGFAWLYIVEIFVKIAEVRFVSNYRALLLLLCGFFALLRFFGASCLLCFSVLACG